MTELHDTHEGLHSHDHGDEKCHEGKTLANHSLFPAVSYEFLPTLFKMEFDVVFNLDPHFKSPFLELDRKPPRA